MVVAFDSALLRPANAKYTIRPNVVTAPNAMRSDAGKRKGEKKPSIVPATSNIDATPDDVKDVAEAVVAHRLIVQPEAEIEGATAPSVLAEILASVPVPRE
jgi:hypothetical protein